MNEIFNKINRFDGLELNEGETFSFTLEPKKEEKEENFSCEASDLNTSQEKMVVGGKYKVIVKKYMTEPATSSFDFQDKWNDGKPMPLRTMYGEVLKETRGMIRMKLQGLAEETVTCLRCGKKLTNPISKKYGIGPECIHHIPIMANIDINDIENIKSKLTEVTWEGWIIKSSILKKVDLVRI